MAYLFVHTSKRFQVTWKQNKVHSLISTREKIKDSQCFFSIPDMQQVKSTGIQLFKYKITL